MRIIGWIFIIAGFFGLFGHDKGGSLSALVMGILIIYITNLISNFFNSAKYENKYNVKNLRSIYNIADENTFFELGNTLTYNPTLEKIINGNGYLIGFYKNENNNIISNLLIIDDKNNTYTLNNITKFKIMEDHETSEYYRYQKDLDRATGNNGPLNGIVSEMARARDVKAGRRLMICFSNGMEYVLKDVGDFASTIQNLILKNTKPEDENYTKAAKCQECGFLNELDAKFCNQCNKKVYKQEATHVETHNEIYKFLEYTVTLVAFVAKGDGQISKNEAEIAKNFILIISKNDEMMIEKFKKTFSNAKNLTDSDYITLAGLIASLAPKILSVSDQNAFYRVLADCLVQLVYANGAITNIQNDILNQIVKILNIDNDILEKLHNHHAPSFHEIPKMDEHYKILKCSESDSNEEIKRKYRQLIKEYHPDVLAAKGLTDGITELVKQEAQRINSAYEIIKKYRGI